MSFLRKSWQSNAGNRHEGETNEYTGKRNRLIASDLTPNLFAAEIGRSFRGYV